MSATHATRVLLILLATQCLPVTLRGQEMTDLERVRFNHPGLVVDLGVGLWAWPLPIDWDRDGDLDLLVSCPDKPSNGTYFFENRAGQVKLPVFQPGIRVGRGMKNVQVSRRGNKTVILQPGQMLDPTSAAFESAWQTIEVSQPLDTLSPRRRFDVWSFLDYDHDGDDDLIIGVDDWSDYGWDDGYDHQGKWLRGPLHGYVYLVRNDGDNESPAYAKPIRIQAGGVDIDVYGNPQPNFADFDGDGDLDLICASFLDHFTYFQNVGTRTQPVYDSGVRLSDGAQEIRMHVQMITPSAIDWDRDGDIDLICGDEDGRVALIENTGRTDNGMPVFCQPQFFQQHADDVKFGALVTPVSVDWDEDGDEDLLCGNTAGEIALIENLDGGNPPRWSAPVSLLADGKPLRIQAGPNGSIQGPAEAKWGYTTFSVADWDHDGRHDLIVNSIWGKVVWFRNTGRRGEPALAAAEPVHVTWNNTPPKPAWVWWSPDSHELVTQWRTTPYATDWDGDGLTDLVMLDHEGYLSWYRRQRTPDRLTLLPGERCFHLLDETTAIDSPNTATMPLRLNDRVNGGSGRRKICIVDWDGDGRRDLLVNSVNADWLQNVRQQGSTVVMQSRGALSPMPLAGHTTSPTTVDWNRDGVRELLIGAEDGRLYHLPRNAK